MLWVYLTVTLMLFSGFRTEDSEDSQFSSSNLGMALQNFLEARCSKNADADALEELKNTALSLGSCLKLDLKKPEDEEDIFNTLCVEIPQTAYRCIGNFVDKMEPCLNAEEKYFPVFLKETFNSTVEEHCKSGAAHIVELMSGLKDSECAETAESELKASIAAQCLPKLKLLQETDESFVLRESDLCSDLQKVKECVVGILKEKCADDVFENTLETTLKPFLSWCSAHESENALD